MKMEKEIKPPVKIGDIFKLGIIRFGKNGDPILKYKNLIIFLKENNGKSIPLNEMIEIKITKIGSNFAYAVRIDGN